MCMAPLRTWLAKYDVYCYVDNLSEHRNGAGMVQATEPFKTRVNKAFAEKKILFSHIKERPCLPAL